VLYSGVISAGVGVTGLVAEWLGYGLWVSGASYGYLVRGRPLVAWSASGWGVRPRDLSFCVPGVLLAGGLLLRVRLGGFVRVLVSCLTAGVLWALLVLTLRSCALLYLVVLGCVPCRAGCCFCLSVCWGVSDWGRCACAAVRGGLLVCCCGSPLVVFRFAHVVPGCSNGLLLIVGGLGWSCVSLFIGSHEFRFALSRLVGGWFLLSCGAFECWLGVCGVGLVVFSVACGGVRVRWCA